ncbi:MAG TPA: hypothetical protein VF313_08350 [Anaerolineaceae bacterium]
MPESTSPSNHLPQGKRPHACQQENRNILKHGFYTRQFHRFDIRSNSNSDLNGIIFTALYA